ncbi:hypothetical protein P4S70_01295 [Enterovibrio sp. Hal110]
MTHFQHNTIAIILMVTAFKSLAGWKESNYVELYCEGEIEYVLHDNSRVDCLTETHAIEYDYGEKWAEALGQSIFYSSQTGKKPGIVLIVKKSSKDRYLARLNAAISHANIEIDVQTVSIKETNLK